MTLDESAIYYHEVYESFRRAGFEDGHALFLAAEAMKISMLISASQKNG